VLKLLAQGVQGGLVPEMHGTPAADDGDMSKPGGCGHGMEKLYQMVRAEKVEDIGEWRDLQKNITCPPNTQLFNGWNLTAPITL
jgi:hypothetical protein